MKRKTGETEYKFVLVLTVNKLSDADLDALFEAGCDDSTISTRAGRTYMTFARVSTSLKKAILSAIRNVRAAKIDANVLRVDPYNLVTQADIARKIGRSRQLVHQYVTGVRGGGGFPGPVCEIGDGSQLWSWCEVASWLCENGLIKESDLRNAEEVDVINSVLEMEYQRKTRPNLTEEVMEAIHS